MPTRSHDIGHRQSVRNDLVWKTSHWKLHSGLPDDGDDLEQHLRVLVDILTPRLDAIMDLISDGWALTWACFISEGGGQGGVTLSPQILHDLGTLPGELWLDIYAGRANNEDDKDE